MNFSRRVLFYRKTTVCLKYFDQNCRFVASVTEFLFTTVCQQRSINAILKRKQCKLINSDIKNNVLYKFRKYTCKETTISFNLFIFGQIGEIGMVSLK